MLTVADWSGGWKALYTAGGGKGIMILSIGRKTVPLKVQFMLKPVIWQFYSDDCFRCAINFLLLETVAHIFGILQLAFCIQDIYVAWNWYCSK